MLSQSLSFTSFVSSLICLALERGEREIVVCERERERVRERERERESIV